MLEEGWMDGGHGDKNAINVKNENKFSDKAIKSWGSKLKDIVAHMEWGLGGFLAILKHKFTCS